MSLRHATEAAARGLKAQNNAHEPHGAGGAPVKPADRLGGGAGMGYRPAKASECLNAWDHEAPSNGGPTKSHKY